MELNYTAQVLIDLAITLLAAFCLSRIAKRLRLPNVTGYILAGILIGPHCLKLIDAQTVEAMSFLTDAALAFIAFGVGKFFKWSRLKASARATIKITGTGSTIWIKLVKANWMVVMSDTVRVVIDAVPN